MIKVQIRKDQISSRGLRQKKVGKSAWESSITSCPVHVARLREKSRKGVATC